MSDVRTVLAACAICVGGRAFAQHDVKPPASANPNTGQASTAANTGQASTAADEPLNGIAAGKTVLKKADGSIDATYRYRLVQPPAAATTESAARFPLIVFLHGSGERGDDNAKQLAHFAGNCASEAFQREHPCFVLAMQCPADEVWAPLDIKGVRERGESPHFAAEPTRAMKALMQALDEVLAAKPVDPKRVYLTGLSLGGFGSFDLAARRPELFAAVVPICGGGDPATAGALARIPFYIVHGSDDPVVPVALSQRMREAISAASAEAARADRGAGDAKNPRPIPKRVPNPMYREYEHVGHDSWTPAYRFGDDGVLDWMFSQRK